MKKYVIGLAVGAALTLAWTAVGTARYKADDEDVVAARKEVVDALKMVETGKGKDLEAKATAIKKKDMDLNNLMIAAYKPKDKGGIGFDAANGMEKKLIDLAKDTPTKAALKKEKLDLIKLAQLNIAMAEVAKPHFNKPKGGKTQKDWDNWLKEQKKSAQELLDEVKKDNPDPKVVSKVAKNLQNSCSECHSAFRDN